jgi:hypothetical protein
MTQGEAAKLLGITQPRVSDLMRGKMNMFSLHALMDMATTAGMAPMVKVSKPKNQRCADNAGGCGVSTPEPFLPQLSPLRNRAEKSATFTDRLGHLNFI